MPRIGTTPEEQTSRGSSFTFSEGVGKITGAVVANHAIPGYDAKCGYRITIERLDPKTLKPTGDEPIDEFLAAGPVTKFHPGRAESSDDNNPELEFDGDLDAGKDDDAEGTCLLTVTAGAGPDKKSKLSTFSTSAINHGVKASLFNGYAPNLVGMIATFTQFMMEKGEGYSGKRDPTCLIVGVGGKEAGGKVLQYPDAQTGGAASGKRTASKPAAKAAASAPASKANGAAGAGSAAEPLAVSVMQEVGTAFAGQTVLRGKINSRAVTALAGKQPPPVVKDVQNLLKDDEWFTQQAEALGWMVGEGEVVLPAA